MAAIDTLTNRVIANIPIGQAAQAVVYVPGAVPSGDGKAGLQPLGLAGEVVHIELAAPGATGAAPTSVSLFDQGLVQVLEASATGLSPKSTYVLALASKPDGSGDLQALSSFMTNPAGAAVVNADGPIRQLVQASTSQARRYLVIAPMEAGGPGAPVQIQRAP
jgi:hypothetical protein